jgi:hypothetical protein
VDVLAAYVAAAGGSVRAATKLLNTKLPTIAAAVASGVNMNEWVLESIECSGAGAEPYTDAQFEAVPPRRIGVEGTRHPGQPQHGGRAR